MTMAIDFCQIIKSRYVLIIKTSHLIKQPLPLKITNSAVTFVPLCLCAWPENVP